MDNTFGIEVLTRRRAKRLTQTELARMAGCSASHLSNVELGKVQPDVALMRNLGELLGMKTEEIVGYVLGNRSKVEQALADDPRLNNQMRRVLTAAYLEAVKAS
jgi:transcriptional regulator with XRE-family HTH domain